MVDSDADDAVPVVTDVIEAERYELRVDDVVAGYAEYRRRTPGTVSFVHTVIENRFSGRGFGSLLARAVLDAARDAGEAVLPYCPFIRDWIERHPAYLDLVPPERRADFGLPAGEG